MYFDNLKRVATISRVVEPNQLIIKTAGGNAFSLKKLYTTTVATGTIDWGDGTVEDYASNVAYAHTYADMNEYIITITADLQGLANGAFNTNAGVREMSIPKSVKVIGGNCFYSCKNLISISFPDMITEMGAGAFTSCSALANVNMPKYLGKIPDDTFTLCTSLVSIIIPKTITSIGARAFRNSQMATIYYEGTEEEWNAITKGTDWDATKNADGITVVYNGILQE